MRQRVSQSDRQPDSQTESQTVSQSVTQSVSQAVKQPESQTVRQRVSQSVREPDSQAVKQPDSQTVRQRVSQSVRQPDSQAVKQPDSQTESQTDRQTVNQSVSQSVPANRCKSPQHVRTAPRCYVALRNTAAVRLAKRSSCCSACEADVRANATKAGVWSGADYRFCITYISIKIFPLAAGNPAHSVISCLNPCVSVSLCPHTADWTVCDPAALQDCSC